jgi:hypothetical protein
VAVCAAGGSGAAGRERAQTTWRVSGQLQAWDGEIWIVDATPLRVPAELSAGAPPTLGGVVDAEGTFDDTDRRVATSVSIAAGGLPNATLPARALDGEIDGIAGEEWSIAGERVRAPAGVQMDAQSGTVADLSAPGNLAHVEGYQLPSGDLLAVSISLAPPVADTPSPTPTVASETPAANAQPPTAASSEPDATEPPDNAQPPADGGDDGGGHGHDEHEQKPKKPKHPKDDD